MPISVGYQSGSHYATIQALEQYMPADRIDLSFADGMLFRRMELLLDSKVPACTLFSGPYYLAEQLGFRKIIDASFMIATMVHGDPEPEDLRKFFPALRSAQRDIDLRPDRYTHYYIMSFRCAGTPPWTPGAGARPAARVQPYTKEVFDETFRGSPAGHIRRDRHGLVPIRGLDRQGAVSGRADRLADLAEQIAARLKDRGETIAIAKSSTGGLIAAALLAVPGASAYFLGGAVVYTRQARRSLACRSPTRRWRASARRASPMRCCWHARCAIGTGQILGPVGDRRRRPDGQPLRRSRRAHLHRGGGAVGACAYLETALADRRANMRAFAAKALETLLEAIG